MKLASVFARVERIFCWFHDTNQNNRQQNHNKINKTNEIA